MTTKRITVKIVDNFHVSHYNCTSRLKRWAEYIQHRSRMGGLIVNTFDTDSEEVMPPHSREDLELW